ncbi:endo-1,4-beta-xylanase [Streptomyces sp. SKN60]|uniref:endo-1,4-beta-xylanase n=1 Tax=Streptomyces sp. SKN60 TaxID=2855506 RepID=UPI0027D22CEB|nr:endo-1,4-beta-xylanase [Streptomyces sp. SKN60]
MITVAITSPAAHAGASALGAAAAGSGRCFGTSVPAAKLGDSTYSTVLDREFTMITPENETKWDTIEPFQGSFNFAPGDPIVDHAPRTATTRPVSALLTRD